MILLLFVCILGAYAACNKNDAVIYKNQGSTFEARFRAFGGAFTFHGGFRQKVMDSTGLSESCAECYALAYDCGKSNCWASCAIGKGARCDRCLQKYKCQENCNKCTKFL